MTTIGYRYSGPVLWQGSAPWGHVTVGEGTETHGAVGCLSTAVAQCLRITGSRAGATPLHVREMALRTPGVYAHGSSAAFPTRLVDAMTGLTSGLDVSGAGVVAKLEDLQPAIADCLKRGGVTLLCVDHDSDRGGDAIGDHWVVGYALDGDRLLVCDPAATATASLDWATLSGPSEWGRVTRHYLVTRCVQVWVD